MCGLGRGCARAHPREPGRVGDRVGGMGGEGDLATPQTVDLAISRYGDYGDVGLFARGRGYGRARFRKACRRAVFVYQYQ